MRSQLFAPISANNNNALLLSVLTAPGDYVLFASNSDIQPNGAGAYTLQ